MSEPGTVGPEADPRPAEHGLPGAGSPLGPLLALVDRLATRVAGQETHLRWSASPRGALRGEADVVTVGVPQVRMAGLRLDRVVIRVERARIQPALVPRLRGGPVTVKATVTQESVDRWVGAASIPLRF